MVKCSTVTVETPIFWRSQYHGQPPKSATDVECSSPNLGGKLCAANGKARKMEPYWVQRIVNESQMLNTNFNPVLCTYTQEEIIFNSEEQFTLLELGFASNKMVTTPWVFLK